jgi:PPM family protein phosphatase
MGVASGRGPQRSEGRGERAVKLTLRYAVRSDRGLVRGNNEDSVYAGPRLLAIADGMGGHAAGEVASKIAISTLERLDEDRPLGDMLSALRKAVEEANQGIADEVKRDPDLEGMGTTLTVLRFSGAQIGLAHIGDSRAYLFRGDHLSQITHDDTYVQSLVDQGQITADEAAIHPRKSVILRALAGTSVDPDVSIREALPGDRYLLCTDGLSDVVSAQTLFETLAEGDPQECADRLVELALRGGGPDNVTCIIADVVVAGYGDDVPVIAGAFVDPTTPDSRRTDSPAERAALINRPPEPEPTKPKRRRRRYRSALLLLLLVVLALGGGAATYAWTQTQFFVGADGEQVAVFRGVDSQFGPLHFFRVETHTDIRVDDLTQSARSQVMSGITAKDLKGADAIVDRLRANQKPLCTSTTPSPTTTPTARTTAVGSPTGPPSAHVPTSSPVPGRTASSPAPPTGSATPGAKTDCRRS